MIKKGLLITIIACHGVMAMAQTNIRQVAKEIISHNLSIQALAIENQVKMLDNKGDMIPDDPEFSYGYLWGSPSLIGNKIAINANQRFKFPSYYAKKNKANKLSAEIYTRQMDLEINRILFDAFDIMIDLTSLSERKSLLTDRLKNMQKISDLADEKFKAGEANRIEVEKAKLLFDTYNQDLLLINTEEKILHQRLVRLNSDQPISINNPNYQDFEALLESGNNNEALKDNPAVEIDEINSQLADVHIGLAKNDLLPDIIVGYASEAINGEKLAGAQMGISVPLWGKPNKIKSAKLSKDMYDKRSALHRQILQNDWNSYNEIAKQSLAVKNNLQASLKSMRTKNLLEKSWQLGEISLLDYLKELPFFYGVEDRVQEAEKQYYKSVLNKNRHHLTGLVLAN
ncbi:MAG: TolC family protein [Bacteroidales bacterium]|nr:TolC family protein [Bacteroidales bacterium]